MILFLFIVRGWNRSFFLRVFLDNNPGFGTYLVDSFSRNCRGKDGKIGVVITVPTFDGTTIKSVQLFFIF
jgi:hypothetical protein